MTGYFSPMFLTGVELYFEIGIVLLIAAAVWVAIES